MSEMLDDNNVKVGKILFLETTSSFYSYISNMYLTLEKFCDKIITFNRRDYYFKYGKDIMNNMLLELVAREKPDYIFTWLTWDEFYFEALLKIKEISPNTKTVAIFGDDVHQFEDYSRYYTLFFDYSFTTLKSFVPKYKNDGIGSIYFTSLTSLDSFYPMDLEKKYDVSFIGTMKNDDSRYELIKYLKENGIKLKLFGFGWQKYPEFKEINGGPLENDEMIKVINQTKINLCFSKNNFGNEQMKAKIFELGACKAFTLCEYAKDYLYYFNENENIVFFRNKKELIEKINYYLKMDDEREFISNKAYERIKENYGLESELRHFFINTRNINTNKKLPQINGKSFVITRKMIDNGLEKIKKLIDNYNYVSFKIDESEHLPYKEYLQIYSIEKTGKDISCCNYYIYSKYLGDYMIFFYRNAFNYLKKKDRDKFLNLNQLLVKKQYFINNFKKFKDSLNSGKIDFVDIDNSTIVNIPLVRIKDYKINGGYENIGKCFDFKFIYKLYSIFYQRKFFSVYPFVLTLKGIFGERFIFKVLINKLKDSDIFEKHEKLN